MNTLVIRVLKIRVRNGPTRDGDNFSNEIFLINRFIGIWKNIESSKNKVGRTCYYKIKCGTQ